ncbi:MAG: DUF4956 domain-containing protein [Oscillospiraceae bacterium]|nr:DUF4956 domain-containing protein [Oscillospiraceae bacterium]
MLTNLSTLLLSENPFGGDPSGGQEAASDKLQALVTPFGNIIGKDYRGYVQNYIETFAIIVVVAFLLGFLISYTYKTLTKKGTPSQNFAITLMILPPVIAATMFVLSTNYLAGFSLAGIFAFTRFRSAAANSKDLSFVFVAMAIGVSCGMGSVFISIVMALMLCVILFAANAAKYGEAESDPKVLRINVPESISYHEMFDPIFQKYALSWDIMRVKLVDLGATYEVSYSINLRNGVDEKAMIDELRTRNGNLSITLMLQKRDNRVQM